MAIKSIKLGNHIVELPDMYVHIGNRIKTSHESEDGCVEILDDRPVVLYVEDGDYWIELRQDVLAEDAALYINESYSHREPVSKVEPGKQWARSDEEDGSVEFLTNEELMDAARTLGWDSDDD